MASKSPETIVMPPGLADFMEGLGNLMEAKPHGDRASHKSKREISAHALALVAKFLRAQGGSEYVPDALAEVAHGLDKLESILEPVLDVPRSANRPPVATSLYLIRADIVALLDAMTDGAPSVCAPVTKIAAARLIVTDLGKQLEKIVSQREGQPHRLLTNWLGKFKNGQFPDESAGIRFQSARMDFRIDLLARDPERMRRFLSKIAEIKARLEALPAS